MDGIWDDYRAEIACGGMVATVTIRPDDEVPPAWRYEVRCGKEAARGVVDAPPAFALLVGLDAAKVLLAGRP